MKLSEYIYQSRVGSNKLKKKTLLEISKGSGLSLSYLSKIESGMMDNNKVSLETLLALCTFFGDKPWDILKQLCE
jgi:transcriptional regulator with XRE-family HTH domain